MIGKNFTALIGSENKLQITYPATDESIIPTVAVPTTKPALPTEEIILGVSNMPILNAEPLYWETFQHSFLSGKNNSAVELILNWEISFRGASYTNGSFAVGAGLYWTLNLQHGNNLRLGESFQVRIWASGDGLDLRYRAFKNSVTRLRFAPNCNLIDVKINIIDLYTLSLGNPAVYETTGTSLTEEKNGSWVGIALPNVYGEVKIQGYKENIEAFGIGFNYIWGETRGFTHASYYPYYRKFKALDFVSCRTLFKGFPIAGKFAQ